MQDYELRAVNRRRTQDRENEERKSDFKNIYIYLNSNSNFCFLLGRLCPLANEGYILLLNANNQLVILQVAKNALEHKVANKLGNINNNDCYN